MKDTFMLIGFGIGLVTGALLYKNSPCAKKVVDKGEKLAMEEFENMEEKAQKAMREKKQQN